MFSNLFYERCCCSCLRRGCSKPSVESYTEGLDEWVGWLQPRLLLFQQISILPHRCFGGIYPPPPPPPLPLPPHHPRIWKVQFCFTLSFKNFGLKSPSLSECPTTLHGVDMNILWEHTFFPVHPHYQTTVAAIQSIFSQPWCT